MYALGIKWVYCSDVHHHQQFEEINQKSGIQRHFESNLMNKSKSDDIFTALQIELQIF